MSGQLAENIFHFVRVLRKAGLPVGPGAGLDALAAVEAAGIRHREDFYWALHCVLVKKPAQSVLFEQAFHVFWRKPKMLEQMMKMFFQQISLSPDIARKKDAGFRRLADAMFDKAVAKPGDQPPGVVELEGVFTASAREVLQHKDFEQMTEAEEIAARAAIAKMAQTRTLVKIRRFDARPVPLGQTDLRATMRKAMRAGGEVIHLSRRVRQRREPPLVMLLDISGSMTKYSRMLLHFAHAMAGARTRMHVFVFGTRLTNITRTLASKDVDEALAAVSAQVVDWSGGTRIGEALKDFNFNWARRVLGQNAEVLLVSDGLERGEVELLETEMSRLHRAAKKIIWLNPLLRYDQFEPRAEGVRTILAYVDAFRPVHNLASLDQLASAMNGKSNATDGAKFDRAGHYQANAGMG